MNIFRILADLSHLLSIFILLHKMWTSKVSIYLTPNHPANSLFSSLVWVLPIGYHFCTNWPILLLWEFYGMGPIGGWWDTLPRTEESSKGEEKGNKKAPWKKKRKRKRKEEERIRGGGEGRGVIKNLYKWMIADPRIVGAPECRAVPVFHSSRSHYTY